jgi:methylmalonyl-CoA mutase C-terminal domain/subunit
MSRPRVLLAKPGLDGHDRGIKVVAMALRDAGAEVVYLGLRQSVGQILDAAEEEDVDVVGLSILSGAHVPIMDAYLRLRDERGMADLPVALGGTISPGDAEELRARGVDAVFPVGTSMNEAVEGVLRLARVARVGR